MRKFFDLRTNWLKLALALAMLVIVVRLFGVQILKHQEYVEEANNQQMMQSTIVAQRGGIYMLDRSEPVPVAMNAKVWTVILDPQTSQYDKENIEKKITEYAGKYVVADWNEVFKSNTLRYYVVARNVPYSVAEKIQKEGLSGVWMQATTKRVYPEKTLGGNLLGFVNADGIGQYGVEGALNEQLSGKNGVLKTVKDVNNIPLTIGDQNVRVPAQNGKNIVLTVDRNIQNAVEKAIEDVTSSLNIANATAIVINPNTGEILALAGKPTYDPADYGNVPDASVYQVDATMGLYEPASVCKTFTFAATINEGKMTPETTFYNTDETIVDGWPIRNVSKGHTGNITMQTALSWSLNTGSTQALRLLGGSQTEITYQGKQLLFDYYYNKFRLGQYTGVELAEADGLVYAPDNMNATDARYANMTFGQGLALTAMQLAGAVSSVVNGGDYHTPTIVAGEMTDEGFKKKDLKEPDSGVIKEKTSATMRKMMHEARLLYGDVAGYDEHAYVGGKTGTAQTVDENGAYEDLSNGHTMGSYVGYGAKDENSLPEYVVVTKAWEKGKATDGRTHAKPIFDRISQYMIRYLKWDAN